MHALGCVVPHIAHVVVRQHTGNGQGARGLRLIIDELCVHAVWAVALVQRAGVRNHTYATCEHGQRQHNAAYALLYSARVCAAHRRRQPVQWECGLPVQAAAVATPSSACGCPGAVLQPPTAKLGLILSPAVVRCGPRTVDAQVPPYRG